MNRPTINEIFSGQDITKSLIKSGYSEVQVSNMLAPMIDGLSKEAFFVSIKAGEALGNTLKLKCKKKLERHFHESYGKVVLAIGLGLKTSGKEIVNAMDVPKGAMIEAKMSVDMFSLGGSLVFDVIDNGSSGVSVTGLSEVKGQVFDWGKGSRALNDVLDKAEQYLQRL